MKNKRSETHPQSTYTQPHTHLLPPLLLALVLGGLQHLLLPQDEEVRGVGVELQGVLLVVPVEKGGRSGLDKKKAA